MFDEVGALATNRFQARTWDNNVESQPAFGKIVCGVGSPLLANAVLNKLDWLLHDQGHHGQAADRISRRGQPNIRFARYADDWCVFITRGSKYVPKIRVPRKALSNVVRRLHEAIRWQPLQESGAARLVRGSAVVRGWSNYYKVAFNFSKAANWLDHKAFWIAAKALCHKFDISTAQCLRKYGRGKNQIGINDKYVLKRAQDISMTWHHDSPPPYEPGTGCYLDDVDWEAEVRRYEGRRPGCMDLKAFV